MERRAAIALGILLVCCRSASALNPSLDVNQYAHTAWTVRDGFFKGQITSIAQTPDGYLWLGTEFGLLRFDGVQSVPWTPPAGERLPGNNVSRLLVGRDGRLWIGTRAGLASWKDGHLTQYPELAGYSVMAAMEDHQGTTWVGAFALPSGRLCAIRNDKVQCFGQDGRFGSIVSSLCEYKGEVWVGAETGLWRWKPDAETLYPISDPTHEILALIEGDNGVLWLSTRGGIEQMVDGKVQPYPLRAGMPLVPRKLLRDREGGLWIGTPGQGVLHVHQGRTDVFTAADGLSGDRIESLFEDREGNIWVAGLDGLDRFRNFAIPTISAKQGLSDNEIDSVLAGRDGSVWGAAANGLNRLREGRITIYRKRDGLPLDGTHSLFEDDRSRIWVSTLRGLANFEDGRFAPVGSVPSRMVHNIVQESAGDLWINDQDQGLFHLLGEKVVERIPWPKLGHEDVATALVPDPARGGLWLGFYKGGVAYYKDGQVRERYGKADGLGEGWVTDLQIRPDGVLWAATQGGLSRIKGGRVATLTSKNGLPCDIVNWTLEDNERSLWLHMPCGLARIAGSDLDAWSTDPKHMIRTTVFDSLDGVRSQWTSGGFSPHAAKSVDGRLWFATVDGVSVIDPRHLPVNKLPPPVHIEHITADGKTYWQNLWGDASPKLRLPPRIRDLEIDYTALSLVVREKVRFKYKLEGRDGEWHEVGNRRQAVYNDLPPRNYRFRVAACNNSGVWNETGASLDFSIDPAYYQTIWFKTSCAAAFLTLLWALYRYRLHQISREFNVRLEERVNERTRIARSLHDTLLQSFHSLMFRTQAARNLLPRRPDEAGESLDGVIAAAEQAIDEDRSAIQDLRSKAADQVDITESLTVMGQELANSQKVETNRAAFHITVEGERHTLSPILQDEVYRIAREVLRNAFQHAHAIRIEAEIRYDDRLFRLRIRDDGKGIDSRVLKDGKRAGHWGLPGIRERAKRIGAQLNLWSEVGAGTEVEISAPASLAYAQSRGSRRFTLFRKKTGTHAH